MKKKKTDCLKMDYPGVYYAKAAVLAYALLIWLILTKFLAHIAEGHLGFSEDFTVKF